MNRLGDMEARISGSGGGRQGQRNRREEEASDDDSEGKGCVPGESVPGFRRGRQLTAVEWGFFQEMKSLRLNNQSVDELFCQGYTRNESFADFTDENVKTMVVAIGKHKHPQCPDPNLVFLSSSFMTKLCILVSWIRFQKQIGGDCWPDFWLQDS